MTPYFRQGDPIWKMVPLCDGGPTIGQAGCTLTCVAQASKELGAYVGCTPGHAARIGKAANAFVDAKGHPPGPLLVIATLAAELGMAAPRGERTDLIPHGERALRECIDAALAKGAVILHVDHDSTQPHGDEGGDHFVLGLRVENGAIVASDPATGQLVRLDLATLSGPAGWGSKTYRVRGARPIRKASA